MLHNQATQNKYQPHPISQPEASQQPKRDQQAPHHQMGKERCRQRVFYSPAHDQRMQSLFSIEFVILQGVYDVETDQPKYHSSGQQQGQHGAVLQHLPAVARREQEKIAFYGPPRSDWRPPETATRTPT